MADPVPAGHGINSFSARTADSTALNIPSRQSVYAARDCFDPRLLQPAQSRSLQQQASGTRYNLSVAPQVPGLEYNKASETPESNNSPPTPYVPTAAPSSSSAAGSFSNDLSAAGLKGEAAQDPLAYNSGFKPSAAEELANDNGNWVYNDGLLNESDFFADDNAPVLADYFPPYLEQDNLLEPP